VIRDRERAQITWICTIAGSTLTHQHVMHNGGNVRFAQVEGQSQCVSRSIGSPGEPGGGIRLCCCSGVRRLALEPGVTVALRLDRAYRWPAALF
jgi:hypothetical protein